jgi:hypothetical protein
MTQDEEGGGLTFLGGFELLGEMARLLALRLGLARLVSGLCAQGRDLLLQLLPLLVLLTLRPPPGQPPIPNQRVGGGIKAIPLGPGPARRS